jgi:hypothetical protein
MLQEVKMRISRSLRITKLQALLLIDLIITAFAAGGYYYIQTRFKPPPTPPTPPPPRPAEFQITNLTIDRPEAGVGEVVRISVKLSNVGEDAGSHSVNLTINDVVRETKTLQLSGGENTTVEFTVTETSEGSYSVKIGSLTGTYKIVATPPSPPPPKPATFTTYNLDIKPYEAWVDEPITISITVRNVGDERGSYSLSLIINNEVRENRTVQLSGGEATTEEFTVTEDGEGSYEVKLGIWTRVFNLVPTGMHTLSISASAAGIEFTLDGQSHTTPYSALLNVSHKSYENNKSHKAYDNYCVLQWGVILSVVVYLERN